jgi:hypothetical protein
MARRNPQSSQKRSLVEWAAIVAAAGTFLGGVAALAANFVGGGASRQLDDDLPNGASTTVLETRLPTVPTLQAVASEVGAIAANRLPSTANAEPPGSFALRKSDGGQIEVSIPAIWRDVETTNWLGDDDLAVGEAVVASSDIDGLYLGWTHSGLFVGASPITSSPAEYLRSRRTQRSASCQFEGQGELIDNDLAGTYEVWAECGNVGAIAVDLVANRPGRQGTVLVHLRLIHRSEIPIMQRVFEDLTVNLDAGVEKSRLIPGTQTP